MPTGRRRFLAAVCAAGSSALAGCAEDDPVDRDPYGVERPVAPTGEGGVESPATSLVDDAHVIDLAVADLTYALSPPSFRSDDGIEIALAFGRTATAEHPATVRARIANRADRELTVELTEAPPFVANAEPPGRRWVGGDDRSPEADVADRDPVGELAVVPTEDATAGDAPAAVERGPEGFWRVAADAEWNVPGTTPLGAGESLDLAFALVGPEGSEGRPPGTYAVDGSDRVAVTAWPTGAPGTDPDSRFRSALPPLPDAEAVTWYHEVDRSTPAYVEPAVERASAPADLAFDLVNRSREVLPGRGWRLYKLDDGAWHPVESTALGGTVVAFGSSLFPGDARRWRLRAYAGDAPADDEAPFDGDGIDVPHLGGGRYAFAVPHGDAPVAAAFDLEAPRLSLEPTGDLERRRDGDAIELESPGIEEDDHPWVLALERADDEDGDRDDGRADGDGGDGPDDLLVERLYRDRLRGLRNLLAVALEADADRVVLETNREVAYGALDAGRGFGLNFESRRTVRFRGRTYELEGRPLEDGTG